MSFAARKRLLVVDVRENEARAVLLEGWTVVSWGSAALPLETPENSESSEAERRVSVTHLEALVHDLAPGKVTAVVGWPSDACLLRQISLPKVARKYLRRVVLSELLDSAPLEENDADIAWRAVKTDQGRLAVASVSPKRTLDHHAHLLRRAGVRPRAAYPRPVAVALACGRQDSVFVEVDELGAEVTLIQGGFPQAVHQLRRNAAENEGEAWLAGLALVVEQMAASAQSALEDEPVQLPVVVADGVAGDGAVVDYLKAATGREVLSPVLPFDYPQHFPGQEYVAALGLAVAYQSSSHVLLGTQKPGLPAIDALPLRHRPKPVPWGTAGIAVLLVLAAYAGLPLTNDMKGLGRQAESLSASVQAMEDQARARDLAKARMEIGSSRLKESVVFQEAIEARLNELNGESTDLQGQLQAITGSAPKGLIELSAVTREGDGFHISGVSNSSSVLLGYAATLRSLGVFKSVQVLQMQSGSSQSLGSGFASGDEGPASFRIKATTGTLSSMPGSPEDALAPLLRTIALQAGAVAPPP
ncbi:MAG: hypothetical protein HY681_12285 [Chloroflexi bacterium]|nr:hypothetical protein [Chloroflexota bacterium]